MLIEPIELMNEWMNCCCFLYSEPSTLFVEISIFGSRNASLPFLHECHWNGRSWVISAVTHYALMSAISGLSLVRSHFFSISPFPSYWRPQSSLVFIGLNPVTAEPDLHSHRSSLLCCVCVMKPNSINFPHLIMLMTSWLPRWENIRKRFPI